jgi:hypothetical protein
VFFFLLQPVLIVAAVSGALTAVPVLFVLLTVKRYLPLLIRSAAGMSVAGNVTNQTAEALLTLKCPLAMRRMNLPARGHGCEHIQVSYAIVIHYDNSMQYIRK